MHFALLTAIPLVIGGVIYLIKSKRSHRDLTPHVDMDVKLLGRIQEEGGNEVACTLLFQLHSLDPSVRELVITDVDCRKLNVEAHDFEKIIFQQSATTQNFPQRSIGLKIRRSMLKWSATHEVKLQICGYFRCPEDKLVPFRIERVADTNSVVHMLARL